MQEYVQTLQDEQLVVKFQSYPALDHGFIQFFKDRANHPLGKTALNNSIKILKSWLQGLFR